MKRLMTIKSVQKPKVSWWTMIYPVHKRSINMLGDIGVGRYAKKKTPNIKNIENISNTKKYLK